MPLIICPDRSANQLLSIGERGPLPCAVETHRHSTFAANRADD